MDQIHLLGGIQGGRAPARNLSDTRYSLGRRKAPAIFLTSLPTLNYERIR